jgi:hypothetical protein
LAANSSDGSSSFVLVYHSFSQATDTGAGR